MELTTKNYTLNVKENITWKDIAKQERIMSTDDATSFTLLDFFISDLIESLEVNSGNEIKYERDKKKIEEMIYNPQTTCLKDLNSIIDGVSEYIKKKIT